jgi:hypothetical protein
MEREMLEDAEENLHVCSVYNFREICVRLV